MAVVLAIWTLVVWGTRVRNVVGDGGGLGDLAVPAAMTVLALGALVDRRRGGPVLALATVGVWGVRLPIVLANDYSGGFKIVHALLAVASAALAVAVLRAARRDSGASYADAGTSAREGER